MTTRRFLSGCVSLLSTLSILLRIVATAAMSLAWAPSAYAFTNADCNVIARCVEATPVAPRFHRAGMGTGTCSDPQPGEPDLPPDPPGRGWGVSQHPTGFTSQGAAAEAGHHDFLCGGGYVSYCDGGNVEADGAPVVQSYIAPGIPDVILYPYKWNFKSLDGDGQCTVQRAFGFTVGEERGWVCPPDADGQFVDGVPMCMFFFNFRPTQDDNCPTCGNPVDIVTGYKQQVETDYASPVKGGVDLIRTYNSHMPTARRSGPTAPWGENWSSRYLIYAAISPGTTTHVNVQLPGKASRSFDINSSGVVTPTRGDELGVFSSNGTGWRYVTEADEAYDFDSTGRLAAITSREGVVQTLSYSISSTSSSIAPVPDLLIQVTDSFGRSVSFVYNPDARIVQATAPDGQTFTYGYDDIGNLTTVTYGGLTTRTYIYNETGHNSGHSLPRWLTGIVDENSKRFATFSYDSNSLASESKHHDGAGNDVDKYTFIYTSSMTTIVDPLGTTNTVGVGNVFSAARPNSWTTPAPSGSGTVTQSFGFDSTGNRSSITDYNGNLTCLTFNARNLEATRTEGLSSTGTCGSPVTTGVTRTITTDWHASWRVKRRIAEPLRITTNAFNGDSGVSCAPSGASTALVCTRTTQATTDANGSLGFSASSDGAPRVLSYTYNALGQVLTVNGPRNDATDVVDVTTYTYDSSGNVATVTNALSQTTQLTTYDGAGRLKRSVDPNGLETLLDYWPRGWLKTRKIGNSTVGYETTSYDYDSVGQVTKGTQPDNSYVSYTYDDAHRLTDLADGLGNRIHYTLDAKGNRTLEQSYDPSNTLVRSHARVIDALNRVKQEVGGTSPSTQITQNAYDGNGNMTSVVDPLSRTTTQLYDALNRLKEVRDPVNGSAAPTLYQYNGQDQLTQVTDPKGLATTYTLNGHGELLTQVSPDMGTTTFTYDAASNLKTKLDARGITATYGYDAINRITSITYPDETVTYAYDSCTNGVGRLCSITDGAGTTSYIYDVKGRVTQKSQTVASLTQSMGYGYNAAGQLSQVTLPSGAVVTYTYANNRPVSVAVNGTTLLDTVVYEPFGPNGGWRWGNSTTGATNFHTRVFDKDYRTKRVTSDLPASAGTFLFDRSFTWDDASRIMAITDLANSVLNASYGYDNLDRLNSASQGTISWGYTYDGVGNRLTATVNAATTTYGYLTTTHRLQSLSGATAKTYSYDNVGNMTGDGTATWTYGGKNRPTQVAVGAATATFAINALGQRLRKATGSTATRFVYDEAGRLWGEYDDTGTAVSETIWLEDLPVGVKRGTNLYYLHPDQLGTPRTITRSSDNAIVWRWDNTEPFGSSAPNEDPSGLGTFAYNFRFPGQYYDVETGNHYNYHRDYDARLGRYVQSDPIELKGGLNTYGYVAGNPLNQIDPEGLQIVVPLPPPPTPGGKNWDGSGSGYGDAWGRGQWGSWGGSSGSGEGSHRRDFDHNPGKDDCGQCKACMPPAGTLCYSVLQITHPHHPLGRHYHMFKMNQDTNCTCRWGKASNDFDKGVAYPRPMGAIPCPFTRW